MEEHSQKRTGILYAIAAYTAWGLLPLYWKALGLVSAEEILAHRMIWSFAFVFAIILFYKRLNQFKLIIKNKKALLGLWISSLLISCNWFTYIWAVNHEQIVEASLGYYINPLFSVFLGMVILKERMNFWQHISLILAIIGVFYITFHYGKIPWIALILALSFGFYGLVKKMVKVDSVIGLAIETLIVFPVAFFYLLFKHAEGTGAFGSSSIVINLLLLGSGIATATPLLWFAQGAQRVSLSTLGFIQYLAPSLSLILGIFLFNESFTGVHFVSFSFIWAALVIYSLSHTKFLERLQFKILRNKRNYNELKQH